MKPVVYTRCIIKNRVLKLCGIFNRLDVCVPNYRTTIALTILPTDHLYYSSIVGTSHESFSLFILRRESQVTKK